MQRIDSEYFIQSQVTLLEETPGIVLIQEKHKKEGVIYDWIFYCIDFRGIDEYTGGI